MSGCIRQRYTASRGIVFLRALVLVVTNLVGCNASEPDSPGISPSPPVPTIRSIRAVVNCLNSIGLELDVAGRPVYLSVRYPYEQVFIVGESETGERHQDLFDRVYTPCGVDIENGFPVPGLKERFERAFPGHTVTTAVAVREGTLHVRTEDKYMFFVTAKGLDTGATINAFLGILTSGQSLAEGYFPAIRMRQEVRGAWQDSRRFCYDTFMYYLAPMDTIRLEFAAFPLRVRYFADHVELSQVADLAGLQVALKEGFNGIPPIIKDVDGMVLQPGRARGLSFPYRQFLPYNADIDAVVRGTEQLHGTLPIADVGGGVDLFTTDDRPTYATPGTPVFLDMTTRSPLLDRVLQLHGESYPPADDRFPDWVLEEYYRRLPHRRPR